MSKSIDWSKTYTPKVGNVSGSKAATKLGSSGSMKADFKKSYEQLYSQQHAEETLQKAFPIMSNILLQRMVEKRPLLVKRPLPYTTESLGGDEEDDGFYANTTKGANATFKSVTKVIPPGTQLTFMQLEKSMNQMWFKTDRGEEIGIYMEEQNRLMTQTDIYEVVAAYMNEQD
jgi:hypothetical protein